jgi:hypothetical protein
VESKTVAERLQVLDQKLDKQAQHIDRLMESDAYVTNERILADFEKRYPHWKTQ